MNVKSIAVTKARIQLGGLLKKVYIDKEVYILEKDGFPIAGIVPIQQLEDFLDAQNFTKEAKRSLDSYKKDGGKSARDLI